MTRLLQPRRLRLPEDDGHPARRGPRIHRSRYRRTAGRRASSTKRWRGATSPDAIRSAAASASAQRDDAGRRRRPRRQVQPTSPRRRVRSCTCRCSSGIAPTRCCTVKTAGDPTTIVPALHSVFRSLDANVPLFDIRTIAEHLEIAVFVQRMVASLLGDVRRAGPGPRHGRSLRRDRRASRRSGRRRSACAWRSARPDVTSSR